MRLRLVGAGVQSRKFQNNKHFGIPFSVCQAEPSVPCQPKRQTEQKVFLCGLGPLPPFSPLPLRDQEKTLSYLFPSNQQHELF